MPKQGRRRKKRRTEKEVDVSEKELRQTPRCFVIKRGAVGDKVRDLVQNMREVMSPNCAKSLRESKINRVEDFLAVAGHFHVSHLIIFTATKAATYMKLARLPQGPTLTFRVDGFTLSRDVRAAQRRPRCGPRDFTVAPLQVLNGFGGAESKVPKPCPKPLLAEMLRGLLPAVDVPNFNQAECRRTALFHYEPETDHVYFRHFTVNKQNVGLERGVSKLLRTVRLPKLGRKDDIADFVLGGGGAASESEVEATQAVDGNDGKVGVRLTEIGPRLKLLLVKVEEGVCGGGVPYHRFMTKTPSQQQVLEQKAKQRKQLQERNAKLEKAMGLHKDKASKKKKMAEKAAAEAKKAGRATGEDVGDDDGDAGAAGAAGGGRDAGGAAPGAGRGKKRFHPLYGKKAKGGAQSSQAGTVEFAGPDGAPERRTKGVGKGKDKGKGKPKGQGKGAKAGGQQKALDRFHQAQKRQRTA